MSAKTGEPDVPALRFDIVAGLTAAAVVLPKAMAYATVAGLPAGLAAFFCMGRLRISGGCGAHYTQTARRVTWIVSGTPHPALPCPCVRLTG